MNALELKYSIHNLIDELNDIKLLNAVYTILEKKYDKNESDFWDELPEDIKFDIEESIKEADRGELFSHNQVMKEVKEKYNL